MCISGSVLRLSVDGTVDASVTQLSSDTIAAAGEPAGNIHVGM